MVRISDGGQTRYWQGAWWTAEPKAAGRYRDPDAVEEALIDAERKGGPPDDMPGDASVEVVQVR